MSSEEIVVRPGVAFAREGNVVISVFRDVPTAGDLERRRRLVTAPGEGKLIIVNVIDADGPGAGMPDKASRSESERQLKENASSIACAAVVVLGKGMKARLARKALSAVSLVKAADFPNRFFPTLEEALDWTAGFGGAQDREAVLRRVRALLP